MNGTITKYLYDSEDILAEYDATNIRIARYTHGPGIDEPLIMQRGGQSYYYHKDGLGSITELTNSSGTIINEYVYNAFGKIVKETEGVQNPYTYTSRERDKESGLFFYRARYYDPTIGKFLTPDPVGLAGGINLYTYVRNNPIVFFDPMGLLTCSAVFNEIVKDYDVTEDIVWFDWIYSNYIQLNLMCSCLFYKESRIDITTTVTSKRVIGYECEPDECGENGYSYEEIEDLGTETYKRSKAGERKKKWEAGTMVSTPGGGLESGGGCDCARTRPPGIYQG